METNEKKRSEIDDLYKWDLSSLFKDKKEYDAAYKEVFKLVLEVIKFKGHIMTDKLYDFYKMYEKLDRLSDRVFMYARLICDTDTSDSNGQKMKMQAQKMGEIISDKLSFVTPEMLNCNYDDVLKLIDKDSRLEEYRFDLEKMFRYKEHTLSEDEEAIITKASNAFGTGDEAFYNLDNSDINLGKIKDEDGNLVELTNSNYGKYMTSLNREVRIDAFNHMYKYFKGLKNTLAACLKGNIKENFFISDVKKFESPLEMSLYSDSIDVSVYKNLINTIHDNMDAMYDYMALRKKALGLDEMHMYDLHVDLIKEKQKDIPFDEGKKIIFEALKPLGNKYLNDLEKAFSEKWIDIYPSKGKRSGAYSWGCYDSYPYLLLNYNDTIDSVNTMIHELGHSMHSYYSKSQNYIDHNYPIFLAEIASTVNEVLLNSYLYKNAETKEEKILYLTEFLDKVRTTIYRQTMFAEFEMIMHDKEANGVPLTEEEFSNTYYELNKLYYGDNVVSDEDIRYEWSRIPHFYTSFYVYKYATGLSSAIAIASDILEGKEGAVDKYIEFLSSGGSNYPLNILKRTGVDMTKPEPIIKSINMFREKLEELKKLI